MYIHTHITQEQEKREPQAKQRWLREHTTERNTEHNTEQDPIKALKIELAEEAFLKRKVFEEEEASRKLPPPLSGEEASSFQKGECLNGVVN